MGAAPMQNIGAYGVEIKEVIKKVSAIEIASGEEKMFTNKDCQFGYRESIFKHELKNKSIISSVTLRLTKTNHTINTTYGGLQESPHIKGKEYPTIQDVSAAVIEIRRSKLPDPAQIGNAGSFFKNPVIETETYNSLQKDYPTVPGFKVNDKETKVPAAWLIEQCGWKGKVIDKVGVHKQQPLVLVNYGGGKGDEILSLAKRVQHSVAEKFGVKLQLEVNVV
jgi:UDP-N-acetylmuramate dehydrogenase